MGRRRRGEPPRYLLHKGTGQAYCTWQGESIYLGEYDSTESRKKYAAFLRRWEREEVVVATPTHVCTITGLATEYQAAVAVHYSRQERTDVKKNLADLATRYGDLHPDEFGPKDLKALRDIWIHAGLARQTVNKQIGRVRRLFRWGVSEQKVEPATLGALMAVEDLRPGRTTAREYGEVLPVSVWALGRALPHMPAAVRAMCLVQYYAGPRPGEVCRMRAEEIHRGGTIKVNRRTIRVPDGVWAFAPTQHKNLLKGKVLVYTFGPRVQSVLAPFLADSGYIFPHHLTLGEKRLDGTETRLDSYGRTVAAACRAAGVPVWTPGRLRHNFFTRMDRLAGLALASTAGGHASIATTEIYTERNLKDVAALLIRHG